MKKILILIWSFSITLFANGQAPSFKWAKAMGGNLTDFGQSVALDLSGNVYTIGRFDGTADFDPGPGIFNITTAGGSSDVFISKLDSLGNFVWAKSISGIAAEEGFFITIDRFGNIYATGYFVLTTDFDPGPGVFNLTSPQITADVFILKLNSNGDFLWAKNFGGKYDDIGYSVAVDTSGNVYTNGLFRDTVDFDPGPGVFNLIGNNNTFISKLDSLGNFLWAKQIEGSNDGRSISIDIKGNVYVAGYFNGTCDFDPSAGIYNLTVAMNGSSDAYVLKLNSFGNFIWAKKFTNSIAKSIAIDKFFNVYIGGRFGSTSDFDPDGPIFNLTSVAGSTDIFVSKLDSSGVFVWAKSLGGNLIDIPYSIGIDSLGNVYTTGSFQGLADFDPGVGSVNLTSSGIEDIFISRLDASGNFIWAKQIGGNLEDISYSIAIDFYGNVYCTGSFQGTVDFDPDGGIYNLTGNGNNPHIFVLKMSQSGVGIIENKKEQNMLVYPNPTYGFFTIDITSTAQVTITNTLGEIVLNQILYAGKKNINLQNQADGVYFVKVVNEGKQQICKLVKQ